MKSKVLGQLLPRKIAPPNPKTNPNPIPNPTGAGNFPRGQLSGCPQP